LFGGVGLGERLNAGVAESGAGECAKIEDTISALIEPGVNFEEL
jgi:hypothetical protein